VIADTAYGDGATRQKMARREVELVPQPHLPPAHEAPSASRTSSSTSRRTRPPARQGTPSRPVGTRGGVTLQRICSSGFPPRRAARVRSAAAAPPRRADESSPSVRTRHFFSGAEPSERRLRFASGTESVPASSARSRR
jgi:hypothetical protein